MQSGKGRSTGSVAVTIWDFRTYVSRAEVGESVYDESDSTAFRTAAGTGRRGRRPRRRPLPQRRLWHHGGRAAGARAHRRPAGTRAVGSRRGILVDRDALEFDEAWGRRPRRRAVSLELDRDGPPGRRARRSRSAGADRHASAVAVSDDVLLARVDDVFDALDAIDLALSADAVTRGAVARVLPGQHTFRCATPRRARTGDRGTSSATGSTISLVRRSTSAVTIVARAMTSTAPKRSRSSVK